MNLNQPVIPQRGQDYSVYGASTQTGIQEPFTVEGSINPQSFDKKPGFDKSRKKIHTRERIRQTLLRNKGAEGKKKKVRVAQQTQEDGEAFNPEESSEAKNPDDSEEKRESQSRGFLEEEILSASDSNKDSQGSIEEHLENFKGDSNQNNKETTN